VWNRLWTGIVDLIGVVWLTRRAKVVMVTEALTPTLFVETVVVQRDGRATSPHDSGGSVA
jgi:hypothetical protein